jgi:DNA segregation ATPase FtsK/SpoIIIE-like protein
VVVDDLDRMVERHQQGDQLVGRLTTIARRDGELGIHLVLATRDPASTIPTLLRDANTARIALHMDTATASQHLVGSDLACSALDGRRPGRGYFRSGDTTTPVPIQAGWADAPYAPGGGANVAGGEVVVVGLDGRRQRPRAVQTSAASLASGTQLEALVEHVSRIARQAGIGRLAALKTRQPDRQ